MWNPVAVYLNVSYGYLTAIPVNGNVRQRPKIAVPLRMQHLKPFSFGLLRFLYMFVKMVK